MTVHLFYHLRQAWLDMNSLALQLVRVLEVMQQCSGSSLITCHRHTFNYTHRSNLSCQGFVLLSKIPQSTFPAAKMLLMQCPQKMLSPLRHVGTSTTSILLQWEQETGSYICMQHSSNLPDIDRDADNRLGPLTHGRVCSKISLLLYLIQLLSVDSPDESQIDQM